MTHHEPTASDISSPLWDVIIIGGGAAGLSAALILARARRRVLVLDAQEPRNRFAPHMHGVLSRDGYSPLDLVSDGYREVRAVDGVIVNARVAQTRTRGERFEILTEGGERALTKHLIVATGARDELPSIPGLAEQWGRGVVACPYCDGYESSGRRIAVLAASVPGLHKAHMLRPYSNDVTVFSALVGELPENDRLVLEELGIRVDARAVTRVVTEGDTITGLALDDGTVAAVDVVFAEPTIVARDEPLRQLGVEQVETPMGPWTAVDSFGRTSVPGVWAVGNSANPGALVPIAAGSGATAALAINGELVAGEVAAASARVAADALTDPAEFWEARYVSHRRETGQVWSGHVNATVENEASGLTPGSALDLGSGEGGDALWFASQGWTVTAVDISATALAVGAARAEEAGLGDRIEWVRADLGTWHPTAEYDLVSAAFLHSPVELAREEILRRALSAVAPGGRLLVVGHGAFPPGSGHDHTDAPPLPTADEVLAALDLPAGWTVEVSGTVDRVGTGRDGEPTTFVDTVARVRRGS
ncbi:thioredoxin reductase/predicted O-methyltransferase YrrM [Leifsonia sp. AK011]|uniref:bifunctional NAD(P)/FAD-dependent oxidoreductase/class I SAM-dependent methyltransferase n=1 Tax=Leifsonia sp. AK011 TaxID=2723075 RepID=UPI0015CCA6BA|nr:bifunctional NAD(P)/FAD-dependent oxidoreductase/class I SAM-dependent methyltransferase [Leifsonia sp. AK011]NYF09456.1 thioredoxin reductase/predicted O-methyltransferase YrrM [Leifsonia sp. AK011]